MLKLEELEKLLRERPQGWWQKLVTGIPELAPLEGTPQPPAYHAEGDVAVHTRLAVENCPDQGDPDLLWVALLHDIGKPATTKSREDGRITAHGHDKLGFLLAEKILSRLMMPETRKRRILWAVRHHMFHHSWQLSSANELSKRQRSYLENPDFPLLLEFLRIDTLASKGREHNLAAYQLYRDLWQEMNKARR